MQYLIIFFAAYAIVCKNQHIGVIGDWSWVVALIPVMVISVIAAIKVVLKIEIANQIKRLTDKLANIDTDK